jgi:hypothetical protein
MRINTLLMTIFLCINTSFCFDPYSKHFRYYNELDLMLFTNGVSCFLDISRNKSDSAYTDALWNVTELASINGHNASSLLEDIHNNLEQRIKQIESLKNKWVERKKIIHGLGCITLGIASSYAIYYYIYKKYYCVTKKEWYAIKKSLEDRGIKVMNHSGSYLYLPLGASNYKDTQQKLIELSETLEGYDLCLLISTAIPLVTFCAGIINILLGLNIHHDDKYLEKYQRLLEITNEVQKSYALKYTKPHNRGAWLF